jgi:hypothetical protein
MMKRNPVVILVLVLLGLGLLTCLGTPVLLWAMGGGSPKQSVDYEAKLNERAASIQEDQRAWTLYWPVAVRLEQLDQADEEVLFDPDRWAGNTERLRTILDELKPERAALVEGARRPGLGYVTNGPQPEAYWMERVGEPQPVNADGSTQLLIGVLLPQLSDLRGFARLLNADAWLAARDGDGGRFLENVEAMLAVAVFADEHPTLINQLVGIACRALACRRVTETLSTYPDLLAEAKLERLAGLLRGLDGGEDYRLDLDGERYFFLDVIQRMYTDDGNGNGQIAAGGLWLIGALDESGGMPPQHASGGSRVASGAARIFSSDRRTIVAMHEEVLTEGEAWSAVPLWERDSMDDESWNRVERAAEAFPPDPGALVVSLLLPALSKAFISQESANLSREGTEAAVAVHRWRSEHGDWPASLEQLTPGLLPAVPIDRMTGQPLIYRVTDRGPVLYSAGMDRDDDGGRHVERALNWAPEDRVAARVAEDPEDLDGDWVFLAVPDKDQNE